MLTSDSLNRTDCAIIRSKRKEKCGEDEAAGTWNPSAGALFIIIGIVRVLLVLVVRIALRIALRIILRSVLRIRF